MTIQLPALAVRASFIATIAAVLAAAMVIDGPGRRGQRARHAGARAGRRHGREAQCPGPPGAAGAAASWLRPRRAGRRRSLRSADRGCRSAAAGGARTGRRRPRGEAHAHRAAPAGSGRLGGRAAALATPVTRRRRAPRAGRHRRGPPSLRTRRARTPSPPSAPTTAARPTSSPRSCSGVSSRPSPRSPSAGWRAESLAPGRGGTCATSRCRRPTTWPGCRRTGQATVSRRRRSGRRDQVIGYVTTSTDAWSDDGRRIGGRHRGDVRETPPGTCSRSSATARTDGPSTARD